MLRALFTLAAAALALAPTAAAGLTRSESSLLREMNRARAQNGAPPLAYDAPLDRAAQAHSAAMLRTGAFSHGSFGERLRAFGVRRTQVAENLAWGTGASASPAVVVRAWLASPGHRMNLLNPGYRRVGIAALVGTFGGFRGATVVTADFSS